MTYIERWSDPLIKRIRALQHREERERTGLFYVEGLRIVTAALQQSAAMDTVIIAPDLLASRAVRSLIARQRDAGIPCTQVSASVFRQLSRRDGPQGLAAIVRQRWEPLPATVQDSDLWVALDAVDEPGDLGTLVRTCDTAGATGLILLDAELDPYDAAAMRARMGALFAQRLIRAGGPELARWQRRHGCRIVGVSPDASADYRSVSYIGPTVLLMSDPYRMQPVAPPLYDMPVRLPVAKHGASLGLAATTGILLYEVFQQRTDDERSVSLVRDLAVVHRQRSLPV
jgi:TrmH family RNA methyltransferase